MDRCIENYKKKAMEWEMEAESRNLDDREVKEWLETRRTWIEKDREKCCMLKQKARVKWDVDGDENSKFFHTMIKRRNNKNNIRGLMVDGNWCEDPEKIKEDIYRYYKLIFIECNKLRPYFRCEQVAKLLDSQAMSLEVVIEEKEIRDAVWDCGSDKAPRSGWL